MVERHSGKKVTEKNIEKKIIAEYRREKEEEEKKQKKLTDFSKEEEGELVISE